MKIAYRSIHLSKANKVRLDMINSIISEYQAQGYVLTLRQLYYQLVSRDVIPNKQKEYAKLSGLLKEGRMAGIVDWNAIEDRLRNPDSPASFNGPEEILDAAINQYQLPRMEGQKTYLEVWVEKDALSGVLSRVTRRYHVPILVNRGYSSASAMHESYKRFSSAVDNGQSVKILYLGDFDPSGRDMIRDVEQRIQEFFIGMHLGAFEEEWPDEELWSHYLNDQFGVKFEVESIALTHAQIKKYNPPPNPAKITDPRADKYIREHGSYSWEVDALKPEVLNELLTKNIEDNIDLDLFDEIMGREKNDKKKLESLKQYL